MNYKNYIPTAERHEVYSHAIQHSALASKELFFDVQKMINHIEFMHESTAHCDKIIQEWAEAYKEKVDHPFKNLYNWVCNLVDKVITS